MPKTPARPVMLNEAIDPNEAFFPIELNEFMDDFFFMEPAEPEDVLEAGVNELMEPMDWKESREGGDRGVFRPCAGCSMLLVPCLL